MPVGNRARLLGHHRDVFEPQDIPLGLTYFVADAEDTGRITSPAGAVSNYTGRTGEAFVQATGAAQPAHSATAFNSRPAFVFDGGDSLRNTTAVATLGWPTGGAFEIWALVENTGAQIGAGATATIFQYPTNAVNTGIQLSISGTDGTLMRAFLRVGQGASSVSITNLSATLLTGRHILRAVSDGTTIRLDVDGVVGTPVACVASGWTGGPRATIGGNSAATAGSLFTGNMNFLGMYRPLPAFYADGLYRALNTRRSPADVAVDSPLSGNRVSLFFKQLGFAPATEFPFNAPGYDTVYDLEWSYGTAGRYYSGSLGLITEDQAVTCVRANSNALAEDENGLLMDFPADKVRHTAGRGRWADTSNTCRVDFNGDLTNAAWTKTNCTAAADLPSPFASTSTYAAIPGCSITVTADGDATCLQTQPVFSGASESLPSGRFYLPTLGSLSPGATVEITQDGVVWTDVTSQLIVARWYRIGGASAAVTLTTDPFGIRIKNGKAGDKIGWMLGNVGRGYVMSGDIYTTGTATVNRSADVVTINNANFPSLHTLPGFTLITIVVPKKLPLPDQTDLVHTRNGWTCWEMNEPYDIRATSTAASLVPYGGPGDGSLLTIGGVVTGNWAMELPTAWGSPAGLRLAAGTGAGARTDILQQLTGTPGGAGTYHVYSDVYPDGQTTAGTIVLSGRTKTAQGLALNAAQKPLDPERPGISRVGLTVDAEPYMQAFGNDPQHEDVAENDINSEVVAINLATRKFVIVLNGDPELSNDAQYTVSPVFSSAYVINLGSQYPSGGPVNGHQFRDLMIAGIMTEEEAVRYSLAFQAHYAAILNA